MSVCSFCVCSCLWRAKIKEKLILLDLQIENAQKGLIFVLEDGLALYFCRLIYLFIYDRGFLLGFISFLFPLKFATLMKTHSDEMRRP